MKASAQYVRLVNMLYRIVFGVHLVSLGECCCMFTYQNNEFNFILFFVCICTDGVSETSVNSLYVNRVHNVIIVWIWFKYFILSYFYTHVLTFIYAIV